MGIVFFQLVILLLPLGQLQVLSLGSELRHSDNSTPPLIASNGANTSTDEYQPFPDPQPADFVKIQSSTDRQGKTIRVGTRNDGTRVLLPPIDWTPPEATPELIEVRVNPENASNPKQTELDTSRAEALARIDQEMARDEEHKHNEFVKIQSSTDRQSNTIRVGTRNDGKRVLLPPVGWTPPEATPEQLEIRVNAENARKAKQAELALNRAESLVRIRQEMALSEEISNRKRLTQIIAPVGSGSKSGGLVWVRGYFRKDGTYVKPHYRSRPK